MQLFQNGAKLGQKMNVKYGHASLLDCFKNIILIIFPLDT
jgi:hypothetical protein